MQDLRQVLQQTQLLLSSQNRVAEDPLDSGTLAAPVAAYESATMIQSLLPGAAGTIGSGVSSSDNGNASLAAAHQRQARTSLVDTTRVVQLVRIYQTRGHEMAKTDPIDLPKRPPFAPTARSRKPPLTSLEAYGFSQADLERVFDYRVPGLNGFLSASRPPMRLGELIHRLEETYCGSVGVEYMHIGDQEPCNFIRELIETPKAYEFDATMKKKILNRTARAQLFENFCALKFSTAKRFGLDGCETMVVAMKAITKKAARENVKSVVMGMSHRGRLNVLVNVMHKPMQQMMSEFQGVTGFGGSEWGNTGDVKYHLGVEFDHFDAEAQQNIHMAVLANPSHLEAVDPLVAGQARAQQYYSKDFERKRVLPIMVHGDASFAGQGVVYETLQMSRLPNYSVGGTIHLVVNNQIGFTTMPVDSGSGQYCTDLAKAIDAPVFHVNADDPEAVTFVAEMALEFRQKFGSDVIIDLIGYRRLGHNELDMPKFTQPLMYNLVANHPPVLDVYSKRLIDSGVVTTEDVAEITSGIESFYRAEYEKSKTFSPTGHEAYLPQWQHMVQPTVSMPPRLTGVDKDHLVDLGKKICTLPPTFTPHPTIAKTFKTRLQALETEENVDFGLAETLAFASLLSDGFHVRFSGQDSQRGTFSHRHVVLHDQQNNSSYCIFSGLTGPRHAIEVNNSLLSEFAALGFEVGYAYEHPDSLVIWEAQFGDFANGAQVIIDQFLTSGEAKWTKQNGLCMMLPHGYDGQGPEHSSARIERFLQLCDDREDVIGPEYWDVKKSSVIQQHNMQVVVVTTPANVFHVLRRQMHRAFRKPLIVFAPKRLLKQRTAFSSLKEFTTGTRFQRYIRDPGYNNVPDSKVRRLLLCAGQVYFDLVARREQLKMEEVAIARVEQLSPFPFEKLVDDLARYTNLESLAWAQEEPMNAGGWGYVGRRIETCLRHVNFPNGIVAPMYVGRDVSAAPAVGDSRQHGEELRQMQHDAIDLSNNKHSHVKKYDAKAKLAVKAETAKHG
eukprot:GHVT01082480.1.p1 GENE.GHVT01082480.1~~GHVT01082480.1.p1  ORF type:complete len:1008 (-),score=159.05 GHVT01082480.1:884-3907(-)